MKTFTIDEVSRIINQTWNGCIDFHDNQGEGSVQYPDLDELKVKLLSRSFDYEFRKVSHDPLNGAAYSYPISEDVDFDTIGLYKNNPDGTQTFIDEMTDEEMRDFRSQENFYEVLNKLK